MTWKVLIGGFNIHTWQERYTGKQTEIYSKEKEA